MSITEEDRQQAVDLNSNEVFDEGGRAIDTGVLNEVLDEVRRLDLEQNIWELDTVGYTVVPPEKVQPPEFIDRLVEAGLQQAEKRLGSRPQLEAGFEAGSVGQEASEASAFGAGLPACLLEDRVLEEAILTPASLAIADYLLSKRCVIDSVEYFIKGTGTPKLGIHVDQFSPQPFPPYAQIVNITWALTDYFEEAGPTAFVPGSHKLCRFPAAYTGEGVDQLVPVTAKKGSLIVWHGNTWHAALPRTAPGLRMSLITTYRRSYLQTTEGYRGRVPQEIYDRNPERFRHLIGDDLGWARDPYTEDYNSAEFINAATRLF